MSYLTLAEDDALFRMNLALLQHLQSHSFEEAISTARQILDTYGAELNRPCPASALISLNEEYAFLKDAGDGEEESDDGSEDPPEEDSADEDVGESTSSDTTSSSSSEDRVETPPQGVDVRAELERILQQLRALSAAMKPVPNPRREHKHPAIQHSSGATQPPWPRQTTKVTPPVMDALVSEDSLEEGKQERIWADVEVQILHEMSRLSIVRKNR